MWNWLDHVLRVEEHLLVRHVLLTCVKPTSASILADIRAAIRIAADRAERKSPVQLRQTYSRDAFRKPTKPNHRKRY